GSTRWSSTLTRIMSSARIASPFVPRGSQPGIYLMQSAGTDRPDRARAEEVVVVRRETSGAPVGVAGREQAAGLEQPLHRLADPRHRAGVRLGRAVGVAGPQVAEHGPQAPTLDADGLGHLGEEVAGHEARH